MRIALDLDDVLLDFIPALVEFHNSTYGTSLTKKDFHPYHFAKVWGGNVEEAIQKMRLFHARKRKPQSSDCGLISSFFKRRKIQFKPHTLVCGNGIL